MVTVPQKTTTEQRREAIFARIPPRYSPIIHFTIPGTISLLVLISAIYFIEQLNPLELLTIPITLVLGFGFEWRAHKDVLHKRAPLLGTLYERHEHAHHVVFTYDDMSLRDWRELWLILMPAYAAVLVFAINVPIALAAAHFISKNVAFLFLATSMFFFMAYEWLHAAYHLPTTSRLFRRFPLLVKLREQHRRHHDPRLMKQWNFNVTFPLFDILHGTLWSPEREAMKNRQSSVRRQASSVNRPHSSRT